MKLGFGFYQNMLDEENIRFARQCGATHAVVHLVDYTYGGKEAEGPDAQPIGTEDGWGIAGHTRHLWTKESLSDIQSRLKAHGLHLEAIENFDPVLWYDILLDGPKKREQVEEIKRIVRTAGELGIPIIGYNFSLAGVASRTSGPYARGGAESAGMTGVDQRPVPRGMVWNMWYDTNAEPGVMPDVTVEELWRRHAWFLEQVIPVAEEAGVRLAAHPDDPPMPEIRQTPRLVYEPHMYQWLLDSYRSPSNALEFCLGTLMEMRSGDIYETVEHYAAQGAIGYVHFRNVRGKVPNYAETFIDEGEIDMAKVLRILKRHGYEGVLIPDHTPQMACDAPWHAGMAYAMGYMRALFKEEGIHE